MEKGVRKGEGEGGRMRRGEGKGRGSRKGTGNVGGLASTYKGMDASG